jgi:hypothetical protein
VIGLRQMKRIANRAGYAEANTHWSQALLLLVS